MLKTCVQQGDGALQRNTAAIVRGIIQKDGIRGLWRGTAPTLLRNVTGVALYMTSLTQLRTVMSGSPYFATARTDVDGTHASVLPKLAVQGNLISGATACVAAGFLLNPMSVLKARFESNLYAYESLYGLLATIVRQGPNELLCGFFASSLRDAPYAGLFVIFYEGIKRETIAYRCALALHLGCVLRRHPRVLRRRRGRHRHDGHPSFRRHQDEDTSPRRRPLPLLPAHREHRLATMRRVGLLQCTSVKEGDVSML
ncbi:mitochondrial carrier, partial [Athelia psychrophila]